MVSAAGSAQREPSMEEILASIRRIIEDNEAGRRPNDHPRAPESTVIEVDAFRSELRSPLGESREREAASRAPAERRPVTLAEVQAQVTPPRASPVRLAPETPHRSGVPLSRAFGSAASEGGIHRAPAEAGHQDTAPVSSPSGSRAAEEAAATPAMLSEPAGKKVAAAFSDLSDAVAARSRKTFDEIAAETLRPMLQEWLDDNLPDLVERLVREEIERVVRGG